jgi:hypothetical protein
MRIDASVAVDNDVGEPLWKALSPESCATARTNTAASGPNPVRFAH